MNYLENENIMFNTLLNCDINTLINLCSISLFPCKICQDKFFWYEEFKHDKMKLLNEQYIISDWIKEYNKVRQCMIDADDIINISLSNTQFNKIVLLNIILINLKIE